MSTVQEFKQKLSDKREQRKAYDQDMRSLDAETGFRQQNHQLRKRFAYVQNVVKSIILILIGLEKEYRKNIIIGAN